MERTSSSRCVNGEFPPRNTSVQKEEGLLVLVSSTVSYLCRGRENPATCAEEKILEPVQTTWATAGEQLMISLATGAGALLISYR